MQCQQAPPNKTCTKCKQTKALSDFRVNRPECKECSRALYQSNKHLYKERLTAQKEQKKIYNKEYRQKNLKKLQEYNRAYQKANKDILQSKKRIYKRFRRQLDPLYKLREYLRCRARFAIKRLNGVKDRKTEELLGATVEIVRQHLEAQFKNGMNWENYGKWHVDHIQPLAQAKSQEELKELLHYTNLQPLWAVDNLRKGNRG